MVSRPLEPGSSGLPVPLIEGMRSCWALPGEPKSIWLYPQGCCLWDTCSSSLNQLLGNSCRFPAWAGCPPADLPATLGPGAVPGLRFGAPGSACFHIGVASALPAGNGETPSERPLLWAACLGWDETSHPHPSWSPSGWHGGMGTWCHRTH